MKSITPLDQCVKHLYPPSLKELNLNKEYIEKLKQEKKVLQNKKIEIENHKSLAAEIAKIIGLIAAMLAIGGLAMLLKSSILRAVCPPIGTVTKYKGCPLTVTVKLIITFNCLIASGVVMTIAGFGTGGLSCGIYFYNRGKNIKKLNAQIINIDKQIETRSN